MTIDAPEIIVVSPDEILDVGCDFAERLEAGESLQGTPVILSQPDELTISNAALVGSKIVGRVTGGNPGQNYVLEFSGETSNSRKLVGRGQWWVR